MWPSLYLAVLLSTQLQVRASSGAQSPVDVLRDSELLDIVLVASVDGDFHVLNRSTGHVQRSRWLELLSDDGTSAVHGQFPAFTAPVVPLVNTGCADSADKDIYIIEPQSGAIYTMAATGGSGSPLQRFPFSVPELVEMSPFSFNPADSATGNKLFVGRKETRVLGVDTQTGKVRSVTDEEAGTIRAQANDGFWSAQEVLNTNLEQKTRKLTEVFVGRTDYHVTIHAGSSSNEPAQTLSFSVYGPDQRDNILQVEYTDTKDDKYMQSAPNGVVLGFDSAGRGFGGSIFMKSPIVAIFDVLRKPDQDRPFVLLQPRAPSSALGTFMDSANLTKVPFVGLAYVGIVEEPEMPTGSLFAMTPDVFPLGAKHGGGRRRKPKRTRLVPRPGGGLLQVAEKEPEEDSDEPRCGELEMGQMFVDRRCLVGMHPLEGTDGTTRGGTPGASDE